MQLRIFIRNYGSSQQYFGDLVNMTTNVMDNSLLTEADCSTYLDAICIRHKVKSDGSSNNLIFFVRHFVISIYISV
jgi:hypothetical protein